MSMVKFELYQHQSAVALSEECLAKLEELSRLALQRISTMPPEEDHVLSELDLVEASLVDDETIARVHLDFMDIPGATDVITFHHGEILVSVETAVVQAREHGEELEREIFRYLVHGLLHLQGHTDTEPDKRAAMHEVQEALVAELWD